MKYINTKYGNFSEIVLGGGQLVASTLAQGTQLVLHAVLKHNINLIDLHHRYGKAESIASKLFGLQKQTKISAYLPIEDSEVIYAQSKFILNGDIQLLFISDLDNNELYTNGIKLYDYYEANGITSESPELALRFLQERPRNDFFMIPIFDGGPDFFEFIKEAKKYQKFIYGIKLFDDGRQFKKGKTIKDCLQYAKNSGIDFYVVGTKNIEHLNEIMGIWRTL